MVQTRGGILTLVLVGTTVGRRVVVGTTIAELLHGHSELDSQLLEESQLEEESQLLLDEEQLEELSQDEQEESEQSQSLQIPSE